LVFYKIFVCYIFYIKVTKFVKPVKVGGFEDFRVLYHIKGEKFVKVAKI